MFFLRVSYVARPNGCAVHAGCRGGIKRGPGGRRAGPCAVEHTKECRGVDTGRPIRSVEYCGRDRLDSREEARLGPVDTGAAGKDFLLRAGSTLRPDVAEIRGGGEGGFTFDGTRALSLYT